MECSQCWEAAFYYSGRVIASRWESQISACWRLSPHISAEGWRPEQQAGRSGRPKMVQFSSESRKRQASPAGLFSEEIEGAMQQAPQPGRQACGLEVLMRGFWQEIPARQRTCGGAPPLGSEAPSGLS